MRGWWFMLIIYSQTL